MVKTGLKVIITLTDDIGLTIPSVTEKENILQGINAEDKEKEIMGKDNKIESNGVIEVERILETEQENEEIKNKEMRA